MPNLLKELEIIEGKESYMVQVYDEGTAGKVGTLSDLQTEYKSNLVGAVNELVTKDSALNSKIDGAVSRIDSDINNLDTDLQSFKTQTGNNLTTLSNKIGELNNLDTETKDNLVNAINEVLNDVQTLDPDLMHYVYVEKYLDLGQNATTALRNAIADCPAKGTVVIPRTQQLEITDTIVIDKPLKIMGLSNGMNQLEGGNNNTPNSEYVKYDLMFTGGTIGFNVLSPSVYIEDLVIKFNVAGDFKVFNLNSQTGDQLNMPRDIRLSRIMCYNVDMSYTHTTYGVYSDQPVVLSTFTDVVFGWVTNGFVFENANINTSLRFIRCNVTVQLSGYFISKGTYCYFECCGCESPCTRYPYSFNYCKSITMVGCFDEQSLSASIYCYYTTALSVIGYFSTTLPILGGTLGNCFMCGVETAATSDASHPAIDVNSVNLTLAGCSDFYVKQGNIVYRKGWSDKVLNHSETLAEAGYTLDSLTSSGDLMTQLDRHVYIGGTFVASGTTATITIPVPLRPLVGKVISGDGWSGMVNIGGTITFTFAQAGTYNIELDYEAIASF